MKLHEDQQKAVDAVAHGHNLFLTGPAGTGKTTTLRSIIAALCKRKTNFGLTALTGCAATLLGARTLHSFLGLGVGRKTPEELVTAVRRRKTMTKQLLKLDVLIIDEVSMLDDELFDTISKYLSLLRSNPAPFGGIQLILSGDFCQLRPVDGDYCFLAAEWERAKIVRILLTHIYRQAGDIRLQSMLSRVRWGKANDDDLGALQQCAATAFPEGILPTRLYARCRDVDRINQEAFDGLSTPIHSYPTRFSCDAARRWATACGILPSVPLRAKAQVVVTWNIDVEGGIVNGTRGTIVDCTPSHVTIRLVNGTTREIGPYEIKVEDHADATVTTMPLKLAWALTIHKSQGMTLDAVEMDLGKSIFEFGQAYTALSRARTLDSVRIVAVRAKSFQTHPDVARFYGVAST